MKKEILLLLSLSMALLSGAQNATDVKGLTFDNNEDTTNVTTIADIVAIQEVVSSRNNNVAHFEKVWSNSSYFDIAYNNPSELTPEKPIYLGVDSKTAPNFKSDWGASLVLGHNYGLHKPIAGILKFNIDYSYIDLNFNHFAREKGDRLYDSKAEHDGHQYIPWCMEKYEANYGMSLGASITAAPFIPLKKIRQLHFLKFNFFYHIGYHVSVLMASYDKKYDINPGEGELKDSYNLNLGHGIIKSLGFRVSWKSIGLGYEMRTGKLDYKNFQTNDFGDDNYKFNTKTNRVFLEIRY